MARQLADWKLGGNGQAVAVASPDVTANHCPVDCDGGGPPPAESVAAVAAAVVASVPAFQSEMRTSANPNKGRTLVTSEPETGRRDCAGDPVAG